MREAMKSLVLAVEKKLLQEGEIDDLEEAKELHLTDVSLAVDLESAMDDVLSPYQVQVEGKKVVFSHISIEIEDPSTEVEMLNVPTYMLQPIYTVKLTKRNGPLETSITILEGEGDLTLHEFIEKIISKLMERRAK